MKPSPLTYYADKNLLNNVMSKIIQSRTLTYIISLLNEIHMLGEKNACDPIFETNFLYISVT